MRNDYEYGIELMEILRVVRKRFYIILITIIITSSMGLYYGTRKVQPLYQAGCRIIIGNPIDAQGNQFRIEDVRVIQSYMNTYCAILKTTEVTKKTVDKLKLNISPEGLKGAISAVPEADTQFMQLKVIWPDPKQAVEILNSLSEVFVEEAKSIYPTINMKVMEKAEEAWLFTAPSRRKYIYLGPIVGVIFSLLIIFGLEFIDNTLRTEEDIKKYLGLTTIGKVPKDRKKIEKIDEEFMRKMKGSILESYRILRTNIYFSSVYKDVKSVVVTSGSPGEGKTMTAAMLAAAIAQDGKKTLLIDCDLRKPGVHKILNYSNNTGLSNILLGEYKWTDIISASKLNNLFILTAGIKPPNPTEILSSARMRGLIGVLKNEFDYIIIDAPPVGIITDAQILSQFTDGCLLVVSSEQAARKQTAKAKELIELVNGRILGVVLNKIRYSQDYKYYAHYYKEDIQKGKDKSQPENA